MSEILKGFNKSDFIKRSREAFPTSLIEILGKSTRKLEAVAAKLDGIDETVISGDMLAGLRHKIREYLSNQKGAEDPFSIKERRLMCYFAGDIVCNDIKYSDIALIIESGWADRYIAPLMRLCLNKWNDISGDVTPMYNLFINRLNMYRGKQTRLLEWKDNIQYFKIANQGNQDGAILFGKELKNSGKSPLDFQSILDIAKDLFHSEYFQKVLRTYYLAESVVPDNLESVLEEHGIADTSMIILSDFINKAERDNSVRADRLRLQSIALLRIGHPSIIGKWKLFNHDYSLQLTVDSARKILNQWLIKDYINEIFRKLFDDSRRRDFWIEYSNIISDVRVIGPSEGKKTLSRIDSLRDSLDFYFKSTGANTGAYAFVMTIGEYKFIEFSEKGNALYIYRNNVQIDRRLNSAYIASVSLLKQPKLPSLHIANGASCRMVHQSSYWEFALKTWIGHNVR